jgi:hypothetical protein
LGIAISMAGPSSGVTCGRWPELPLDPSLRPGARGALNAGCDGWVSGDLGIDARGAALNPVFVGGRLLNRSSAAGLAG